MLGKTANETSFKLIIKVLHHQLREIFDHVNVAEVPDYEGACEEDRQDMLKNITACMEIVNQLGNLKGMTNFCLIVVFALCETLKLEVALELHNKKAVVQASNN